MTIHSFPQNTSNSQLIKIARSYSVYFNIFLQLSFYPNTNKYNSKSVLCKQKNCKTRSIRKLDTKTLNAILNTCGRTLQYNKFQNIGMSNQQGPFNPYMFPFPFNYPPPPFMNPMMPPQQRNTTFNQKPQQIPNMPTFTMPPFAFPHFPMMYPPPPPHFFPYHQQKMPFRQTQSTNAFGISKDTPRIVLENQKNNMGPTPIVQKRGADIIELSDDQPKPKQKIKRLFQQRKTISKESDSEKQFISEKKTRRIVKKPPIVQKVSPLAPKNHVVYKKKDSILKQKKIKPQIYEDRQPKNTSISMIQNQCEGINRSTRTKFLTAKDGKGKIMIGEDFQADLPQFYCKSEVLTVWVDHKKNNLLSRFIK